MAEVECTICYSEFTHIGERVPLVLPCGHSFCRYCLISEMGAQDSVRCPTCRTTHRGGLDQIPRNFALVEIISCNDQRNEKLKSETYLKASEAIHKIQRRISSRIKSTRSRIRENAIAHEKLVLKVADAKAKIVALKLQVHREEAALNFLTTDTAASSSQLGERSCDAISLINCRKLLGIVRSDAYFRDTQQLCKIIVEKQFLAFHEVERLFDMRTIRKRCSELQTTINWAPHVRDYYEALLKLEYHYLFPRSSTKFDIFEMLDVRSQLCEWSSYRGDDVKLVCDKLIEMHPNVPMQIRFHDRKCLRIRLHSTIEEVYKLAQEKFGCTSLARGLFVGETDYASMSGYLFDHCEHKSVFSLWPVKEELEVVIEAPQLATLKSFRVPVNCASTIYEVKQLINFVRPYQQIISFEGFQLDDERTMDECNIVNGSVIRLTIKDDGQKQLQRRSFLIHLN